MDAHQLLDVLADLVAQRLEGRTSNSRVRHEFLSVAEVARQLDRHPVTVRADLKAGRLPGQKVGRAWRVRADVLEQLLDERARQQHAARAEGQRKRAIKADMKALVAAARGRRSA